MIGVRFISLMFGVGNPALSYGIKGIVNGILRKESPCWVS
jgi:hypothetical protein